MITNPSLSDLTLWKAIFPDSGAKSCRKCMISTTAEIALCPKTDFRSNLLKVSGRYTVISGNSAALSSTTPLMYPVYPHGTQQMLQTVLWTALLFLWPIWPTYFEYRPRHRPSTLNISQTPIATGHRHPGHYPHQRTWWHYVPCTHPLQMLRLLILYLFVCSFIYVYSLKIYISFHLSVELFPHPCLFKHYKC